MNEGYVKTVWLDKGYGFIASPGSVDFFFNVRDMAEDLEWDESLQERRVKFQAINSPRGPKAMNVMAAD